MRIAVVGASPIPFCRGGIENFMAGLYRAINDYTVHSAELIKIPVCEHTVPALIRAYYTFYRQKLDAFDLVITTKYPAWNLRHRNHVIFMGHRLRGLYDTYPITPENDSLLKHSLLDFPGPWIKRFVHWLDNRAIRPETISHTYCTSHTIAARTQYFHPDLPPAVVYHSTVREDYRWKPGEHIFTVNRLDAPKRVDLMIRAYRQTDTTTPFLIAGTGPHFPVLRSLASGDPRIQFLGDVSEEELIDLYARATGVLYTPYAEDYGLITVEAMKSGKPVITTSDSGGPLEFVKDGVNGWIADPNPASLAASIQQLVDAEPQLATMAEVCRDTVQHITWQNTVDQILAPYRFWPLRESRKLHERRRITFLVPYPVYPARSGGQRRVAGICRELSRVYDVYILALGRFNTAPANTEITPWLHEIRIPMAAAHARKQWEYEKLIGETVSDAALDQLLPLTPNYIRALSHFAEASDIIVSEQPYMHRHIPGSQRLQLIVHSSQNFEYRLKEPILGASSAGRKLLKDTRSAEAAAIRESHLFFATSDTEGNELIKFYGRRRPAWALAPNGVDTEAIQPVTREDRSRARDQLDIPESKTVCLFVGAWHPPNLEAFEFIARELAPRLPDIHFLIVGSVRDHFVHQNGQLDQLPSNVVLTGEVTEDEKNQALAAADIALNPMISGGGTNLKILEYAAAGIPTVSTPVGIRGLILRPGKDVCIAEPGTFCKDLQSFIADEPQRSAMIESARLTVMESYDWKSISRRMISEIEAQIPPAGPLQLSMDDPEAFVYGWHQAERWDDCGKGPGYVRWTTDRAQFRIASPRVPSQLELRVQSGKPDQLLTILQDDIELVKTTLASGWMRVFLEYRPRPGDDHIELTLLTDGWSPSETGSADTRRLGVAVADICFSRSALES